MRKLTFLMVVLVPIFLGGWFYADSRESAQNVIDIRSMTPELQRAYRLAENGNPQMQLKIGYMFSEGDQLPKNPVEAEKWLLKAAESGLTTAESLLGSLYLTGEGVQQNYAEAEKWLRRAAGKGHQQSQGMLGGMLYFGHGCEKNYVQAFMWLSLAADAGNQTAVSALSQLSEKMSTDELLRARELTESWRAGNKHSL